MRDPAFYGFVLVVCSIGITLCITNLISLARMHAPPPPPIEDKPKPLPKAYVVKDKKP
jgi:hypothetical protein